MHHRALPSCSALLCCALFTTALMAAPGVENVTPNLVNYGKGGEVTVTLRGAAPYTQLSIIPGGPVVQGAVDLPAPAEDIAINKDVTVIAAGTAGILMMNSTNLQITGSYHDGGDYGHIALHGEQVLAADKNGRLIRVDIHDPHQPRLQGSLQLASKIIGLSWHGAHAYLLLDNGMLQIVATEDAVKLQLLSAPHLDDAALSLTDNGNQVFVAAGEHGLLILDANHGKLIGRYRTTGPALDVAVQQGLVFVAQGENGLLVLDVRTPAAPIWIGSHGKLGDVQRVKVQYDRALLFNQQGQVTMVDISRPDMPSTWATFPIRDTVRAIALQGRLALAASGQQLRQIDFTAQPPQISNEGLDVGRGVNFGGERRAYIDGNIIYVADWFSGIHLYDISHPDHPTLLSSFHTPGSAKGITVRNGIAYVAADDHGLQVVDVHDPLNPNLISNLATPGLAYIPKLVGDTLYLAGHRGGFQIIDIKDAAQPHLITSVETPGMAWGIAVDGGIAYVADDQAGLLLIDVKDSGKTRLLGDFNPGGRAEDVVVRDGIAYVSFFDQGLYVVDVRDPAAPKEIAHLLTPGNARGIALQGDYLYLADWLAGVEVIDVHDPVRPQLVGSYDTPGAAWGVNAQGEFVYVMDWWGGFMALNIKDPQHPVLASRYHERGRVEQIAAQGNFLYTANGSGGLQVFDDKNPLNPTWVTGVDTDHPADRIMLDKNLVLLDQTNGVVSLIDIKNPFQSYEIGELNLPAAAVAMAIKGDTAYFAVPKLGIVIADISVPRWPKEVARFITPVTDMCLDGDTLYVLTPSSVLRRLNVSEPRHPTIRGQEMLSHDNTLLRAMGSALVTYQPQQGLTALHDQGGTIQPFASYPFKGIITDMAAVDDKLYVTVADDGVYLFTLDAKNFHLREHYPLTSRATRVTEHNGTLYFAGESAITALLPLPNFVTEQKGADAITVKFPPYTPLGSYGLMLRANNGDSFIDANALQVVMARFSRPKITQEEFKRLLRQYRATNQGQVQPVR
jgi:hypothetical protein